MTYREAVSYLESFIRFGICLGLDNITCLLGLLGNPQDRLKVIHIGGTNGKGSSASFINSILNEASFKVGLYTSPHLLSFQERIRINSRPIPEKELIGLTSEIKALLSSNPSLLPTYFEVATAICLSYFAKEEVEIAILEVGMGGRLDATNVVNPLVSVITNVDLEHTDQLGKTIREIAYEKAGIIKEKGLVVTACEKEEALEVIKEVCSRKKAKLFRVGKEIKIEGKDRIRGLHTRYENLKLPLIGEYQLKNAACAIGACELLGQNISKETIIKGLANTCWPGRLEVLSRNPLLVLDGAHNPAAISALFGTIAREFRFENLILIIGILKDKDIPSMIEEIFKKERKPEKIHIVRLAYVRGASPKEIEKEVAKYTARVQLHPCVKEAILKAKEEACPKDLILITGSLYAVAEVLDFCKS
ncbi:bifunctional folylpolyglutamate synthase/dihydrofolate synthase [bacterium]|nr:bifunctional folylpolyglutamate synthase/dihydrofolate synthase [bacterium]MBU1615762.1 bifunctional folylpolyglutamate synthase/dihydrofolate synthase [bacterium]